MWFGFFPYCIAPVCCGAFLCPDTYIGGKEMANIKRKTRAICEAAVSIALALALSFIKFKIWGEGGSVDFVMVPILVFALRWGAGWGVLAGAVFGFLKCILFEGLGYNWASLFLDYVFAYGAVGLAGIFRGRSWGVVPGVILGCLARYGFHCVSGVVLYASYMPDIYMGIDMNNVWVYTLIYNGTYMLPNTLLAVIILILLKKSMGRYILAEDLAAVK